MCGVQMIPATPTVSKFHPWRLLVPEGGVEVGGWGLQFPLLAPGSMGSQVLLMTTSNNGILFCVPNWYNTWPPEDQPLTWRLSMQNCCPPPYLPTVSPPSRREANQRDYVCIHLNDAKTETTHSGEQPQPMTLPITPLIFVGRSRRPLWSGGISAAF